MAAWNFYFFFYDKIRRGSDWFTQDMVMEKWVAAMPQAHNLAVRIWEEYPAYAGPLMGMDVQESIRFWEECLSELG
jgi:hypothetical protein